ncbi:hypothetical protein CPB97_010599 [Podila verticillata]|nr:hypothetical protein CPB97_010599 [Podila verticillata]
MTHNHPKTRPRRNILSFLPFTLVTALTVFSTLAPTTAAAVNVTATGAAAYVQVNGKFYVHGGEYASAVVTGQLLCLDLTIPWNASTPEWTILPPSPFVNSYHTATYSSDRKTLYFLGFNSGAKGGTPPSNFLNIYSLTSGWQTSNAALNVDHKDRRDFQGALDPTTGRYMFLGGNYGVSGGNMSNNVNVFDTASGAFISEEKIPFTELSNVQGNVVGYVGQGMRQGLYSLAGEVNNGSSTSTSMVSMSDDNSTLVMFGGFGSSDTGTKALADVFILDGKTMTWKAGAAMPGAVGVGYPACTIASNQLIVWGGFTTSHGIPPTNNTMRVYDIASDKWVGDTGNSNTGSSKSAFSIPVIIGIAVGAVVLIVLITIIFVCWRRRRGRRNVSVKNSIRHSVQHSNKHSDKHPDKHTEKRSTTESKPRFSISSPLPSRRSKRLTFLNIGSSNGTNTESSSSSPSSGTYNPHSRLPPGKFELSPILYPVNPIHADQAAMLLAEDQASASPGPSPRARPFQAAPHSNRASMASSTGTGPSIAPVLLPTSPTSRFLQAPAVHHHNNNHNHNHNHNHNNNHNNNSRTSMSTSTSGQTPSTLQHLLADSSSQSNSSGSVRYSTVSNSTGYGPQPTFASAAVQTLDTLPLPPRPSLSDASLRTQSTYYITPPPQVPLPPIHDSGDGDNDESDDGGRYADEPDKTELRPLPTGSNRPQSMAVFDPSATPYVTRARVETVVTDHLAAI